MGLGPISSIHTDNETVNIHECLVDIGIVHVHGNPIDIETARVHGSMQMGIQTPQKSDDPAMRPWTL